MKDHTRQSSERVLPKERKPIREGELELTEKLQVFTAGERIPEGFRSDEPGWAAPRGQEMTTVTGTGTGEAGASPPITSLSALQVCRRADTD